METLEIMKGRKGFGSPDFQNDVEATSIPRNFHERIEAMMEEAYMKGLLHGINASSMARVKNDEIEFEDYDWE